MEYTTEFEGKIKINKELDQDTYDLLTDLSNARRMKRDIEGYGIDGEFYIDDNDDSSIINRNTPPSTQPGLWLDWIITEDKLHIEWNGAEKFYNSPEWMSYIINKILSPKGYILNGSILAQGEDISDRWKLIVSDNYVYVEELE